MAEKGAGGPVDRSVLWRRLDQPGHEAAYLVHQPPDWQLAGTAVFAHDRLPCRLDYRIVCSAAWETRRAVVTGWIGDQAVEIEVSAEADGRWLLNGVERPVMRGCIDIDLNFSPSTNLLPIRRLNLAVGEQAQVRAAWLRFPSFALEPLDQVYRRTGATTYVYESAGGAFVAQLQVNAAGFVTGYAGLWACEAGC